MSRPILSWLPWVTSRCQRFDIIGDLPLGDRVRGRIKVGLGIRSGLRRLLRAPWTPARERLGAPSRHANGAWVRVRDERSVRQTLDARSRLRGLQFNEQLWATCGRTYRVARSVRRLIDDDRVFRPVSGTVLLEGVDCGGEEGTSGCGRFCPMMYRDEWLEPAEGAPAPATGVPPPVFAREARFARIRSMADIEKTLDLLGRREHLTFMPEMSQHAGKRLRVVHEVSRVLEYDRSLETSRPVYLLDGLRCTGAILGKDGPCDRDCLLLWSADWLEMTP